MQVTATSINFDLSKLGLTAEQASNERVVLKALLDYFNKNHEQSRLFGVGKFSDSKPRGAKDGSRANTYSVYIVLYKEEMALFENKGETNATETQPTQAETPLSVA